MNRLLVPIPSEMSVTTRGSTTTTTVNPGLSYWLTQYAPDAEIICSLDKPEQCSVQFDNIMVMVAFKLAFGIDSHDRLGGLDFKYVKSSKTEIDHHRPMNQKITARQPIGLEYRLLRDLSGVWRLYCPFYNDDYLECRRVWHRLWYKLDRYIVKTNDKALPLDELVEVAHELRQIYLPAPIVMHNKENEVIDVTDADAVVIALLH